MNRLLDDVIEINGQPDPEHKKSMYPYLEPPLQMADEIDKTQKPIDHDFIDLQSKFGKVNDVATEQKKQKKTEDTIESAINDTNTVNTFDDFWWEDELFSNKESQPTVDASRNIPD